MSAFVLRITMIFLTIMRFFFPNFDNNISYEKLPINFAIENISDIYVPADNNANVAEYPTVIRLCHQKNEADNGKLLATFEKWGDTYPIYESTDDAESWHYLCTVRDNLNEGYWNEWMPFFI